MTPRRVCCCMLAAAVMTLLGADGEPRPQDARTSGYQLVPFAIYTHFTEPPAPTVVYWMQQEVERLLAPLGLPITWWSRETFNVGDMAAVMASVTFDGSCRVKRDAAAAPPQEPLGFTEVSDGEVIPFAVLNCDLLRKVLGASLRGVPNRWSEATFGRALGRVEVHELFHILVGSRDHGSGPVTKSAFQPLDLLSGHFAFGAEELRELRASVRQARRLYHRQNADPSPATGAAIVAENHCAKCHGKQGNGTRSAPSVRIDRTPEGSDGFADRYRRARRSNARMPDLDDDELADIESFLSSHR